MAFDDRGHPAMDGQFHLVAVDREGNALYAWRNFRVGGRSFRLRRPDGRSMSWDAWDRQGRTRPRTAPAGRWSWNQDFKELFA